MKKIIVIMVLVLVGRLVQAQDTVYVSQDKTTALLFSSPVTLLGAPGKHILINNRGNGVVTLKASRAMTRLQILEVQVVSTNKVYRIPVVYSYGRAGRRISYDERTTRFLLHNRTLRAEQLIAKQLISGNRSAIAAHKKSGAIKAWINKISLADNRIYFRLDLRNRGNLPYAIDFVRFYIRDRKKIERRATHEQEIVPIYNTFKSHSTVLKGHEAINVFAFKRFSLSDDEALFMEVYERTGNRHLYLQIKQGDLDDINIIPASPTATLTLTANQ